MRAVVQRVSEARVKVENRITGEIGKGFLVLVGIGVADDDTAVEWLVDKVINLRVFEDAQGKMNLSLLEIGGALLAISQFTLMGDARKGRRPSFTGAAEPVRAKALFNEFLRLASNSVKVETGVFQAHMEVELINDGPVTVLLDSDKLF